MGVRKFIYWQDEDIWLGYLEEYPDYITQGETLKELKENLIDIYTGILKSEGKITFQYTYSFV